MTCTLTCTIPKTADSPIPRHKPEQSPEPVQLDGPLLENPKNVESRDTKVAFPKGMNAIDEDQHDRATTKDGSWVDPVDEPWKRDRVPDMVELADPGDEPFEAHPKPRVGHTTIPPQI